MAKARVTIEAAGAPAAIGPYSHGVLLDADACSLLFCSGQIPLHPETGEIVSQDVAEQTRRCLQSLSAICEAAGATLQDAVRLTIYTTELHAFAQINDAYGAFFEEQPPARAAIGVTSLPKGAKVEIDAIVAVPRG